jgi:SRSO17 transposase
MNHRHADESELRFARYVGGLASVIGTRTAKNCCGKWSDAKVLAKVREMVVARGRAARCDRGLDHRRYRLSPTQGQHSVGVAWQYCGQLGKQNNCQVAVSPSLANHHASLPVAHQLICREIGRMTARAGVPEEVEFKSEPQIALEQLRWAHQAGLPRGVALLDAG